MDVAQEATNTNDNADNGDDNENHDNDIDGEPLPQVNIIQYCIPAYNESHCNLSLHADHAVTLN